MRKKKLTFAILIVVCLSIIAIMTAFIIRYVALVKETEHVELPEIVFHYVVDDPGLADISRIIDRDGNIYDVSPSMNTAKMVQLYRDGRIEDKLKKIGTVNVVELKKRYQIFMELVNNPEYNPQYPPDATVPDVPMANIEWYGYYYDDNYNLCHYLLYQYRYYAPEVSDKRGPKLAEWIEKNVRDD